MPRKKVVEYRQQVYDIGDDATVTIRFDPARRPAMKHLDGVVIVGDHACSAQSSQSQQVPAPCATHAEIQRGGNLGEIDQERIRQLQEQGSAREPAPPGFSPRVVTSEDILREAGMLITPNDLLASQVE